MKQFILLSLFSILFLNYSFGQSKIENDSPVYILEFPKMEQQKVKPLVAILRPLFEKAPQFEKDNYAVFYYKTDKEITKEDILEALKNSGYILLNLDVVTIKEFEKEHDFMLY